FVENGSYLRMSYAQFSYQLKKPRLKSAGINKVNLYLSANNPFVLTKYTGVDPDVASYGYGPAVDSGKTPRAKSFTLGITLDF
ncbi:MAG: SusC/RagA family TonB-linked outer membrane protein, partial [Bacteroidales bacterium]|nr:SusC/RagA family TonB-linked outer membrane protein [Bacteroidales bacterium]